jgi:hypothetical protein
VRCFLRRLSKLFATLVLAPALGAALLCAPAAAQRKALAPADSIPGSELKVTLLTMGPGEEVWERFGHNAIWIEDRARGTSIAYNYGLFSFRQENFILRFIQGKMQYWMAGFDAAPYIDLYVRDHRSVWAQELNLPPAARLALRDFLEWNALPENKFYHYDYYRDNCSTRVRDALDRVAGGAIRRQSENEILPATYRWHTRRLTAASIPVYTGLDLLLGPRGDRPLSAWEEMFLPQKLQEHIREVSIEAPDGRRVPLVKAERTLYLSDKYPVPDAPAALLPAYLAAGLLLGMTFLLLGRAAASRRWARRVLAWSAGLWALVTGLAGLILAGMWAFTDHVIVRGNQNLLQVCLLALVLLALLPSWTAGRPRGRSAAPRMALVLVLLSAFGLLLTVVPGVRQMNAEIVAVALPALLGLALGLRAAGGGEART